MSTSIVYIRMQIYRTWKMSPTCPDGFDRRTWEEIAERPLNDTFLLELAAELNKRDIHVDDLRKCLNLNESDSKSMKKQPDIGSYGQLHTVLTEWHQTAYQLNKDNTGDLIACLSKLRDINTVLSDFCSTFFKLNGR